MESSLSWELPLPEHFEAVAELVTQDQVAESVTCGPDPERHLAAIRKYAAAGIDHICVHQVGKDQKGFFEFYARRSCRSSSRSLRPGGKIAQGPDHYRRLTAPRVNEHPEEIRREVLLTLLVLVVGLRPPLRWPLAAARAPARERGGRRGGGGRWHRQCGWRGAGRAARRARAAAAGTGSSGASSSSGSGPSSSGPSDGGSTSQPGSSAPSASPSLDGSRSRPSGTAWARAASGTAQRAAAA